MKDEPWDGEDNECIVLTSLNDKRRGHVTGRFSAKFAFVNQLN